MTITVVKRGPGCVTCRNSVTRLTGKSHEFACTLGLTYIRGCASFKDARQPVMLPAHLGRET
jgi:hypothetical protein